MIRVHELAKELKISVANLRKHFAASGVKTKSHMSLISDEDADAARSVFPAQSNGVPQQSPVNKTSIEQDGAEETIPPDNLYDKPVMPARKKSRRKKDVTPHLSLHKPLTIYLCPSCGAYIIMSEVKLGITGGFYLWSDMYQEHNQFCTVPELFKCWCCGEIHLTSLLINTFKNHHLAYLYDFDKVELLDEFFENDSVSFYDKLDLADYQKILGNTDLSSKTIERKIRILYLWEYNMRFRFEENGTIVKQHAAESHEEFKLQIPGNQDRAHFGGIENIDPSIVSNMEALIELLEGDRDDWPVLMRAELFRELEMYDKARYLTRDIALKSSRYSLADFREWCRERCPCVRGFKTTRPGVAINLINNPSEHYNRPPLVITNGNSEFSGLSD